MSTSQTGQTADIDPHGWQAEFEQILPKIQRLAQIAFRACSADLREELVAEVTADTCIWFRRLCQQGRRCDAYPSVLAKYSIKRIGSGVRVGCPRNKFDALSRYAQLRSPIQVQSLQRQDTTTGTWREMLLECRRATPADLAAMRVDFQTWLGALSSRDREIAILLASGEETRAVASRVGLSNGRISQKRRELAVSWFTLHGLDADGREISTVAA